MSIAQEIDQQLRGQFSPAYLDVANESHQHSVPANAETHFRVVLVSENFSGLRRVARHQQVYKTLSELLAGPVHALALHTYTPEEWQQAGRRAPGSPECMGGSKGQE